MQCRVYIVYSLLYIMREYIFCEGYMFIVHGTQGVGYTQCRVYRVLVVRAQCMCRIVILTIVYSHVYYSTLWYTYYRLYIIQSIHNIGYTQCRVYLVYCLYCIVQVMHMVQYQQCRVYINSVQCRVCRVQGMNSLGIYGVQSICSVRYAKCSVHTVQGTHSVR